MTPDSGQSPYLSAADMLNRHDPRLCAQLVSFNPFQPVIYAPTPNNAPFALTGTASVVNASGNIVFSIPQSGITGSTCQFAGDASAQTYMLGTGQTTNFTIQPVYGGASNTATTCTIVPTDTLSTNPKFLEALNSASGELESAVLRSNMYKVSDLQSLTGNSLSYLKQIVSNIAMMYLYTLRDGPNPSETTVSNYNNAMAALKDLADGVRIFAFNETQQAGLPTQYQMQVYDFINNNMVTARWPRCFGIRQNERRIW